ncbi:hypothetical protein ACHAWC_005648 [Mediolabrus comicus]
MTFTIAKEEQEAIPSSPEETQEDATTFIGIGGDEIVIDLSAEAVAEGADILEDVAFDTLKNNNSKKRPFDASHKKKQRSSNNNNKKKKQNSYDSSILNESTTIEDLQTIDASAYLAWVNSQAGALPSVFVADEQQNDNNSSVISAINKGSSKKDEEGPIDGSAATVQILLSKRMDILPPPTIHHIPPTSCNASIFHINSSESSTEDDVVDASEDTDGTNNTNNWLNTTISSFSKLRSYLETQDALRKQTTSNNNHNNVDDDDDNPHSIRKIAVPKMKDRSGWHVFCLGREEAFGNKGGYFEDVPDSDSEHDKSASCGDIDDVDNDEDEQSSKVNDDIKVKSEDGDASTSATNTLTYNEEQVPPSGYTPTTSLLLQLDQVLTRVLFHHHVHYLCEWKFSLSHQRAAWIYALLARMNKPWHRDECCAVRRVLRECCSRRYELSLPITTSSSGTTTTKKDNNNNSTNEENDKKWEQLAMLNTLIAVTGVYYEQGSKAGGDGMDVLFSVSNKT